jgi:hypothetical protein
MGLMGDESDLRIIVHLAMLLETVQANRDQHQAVYKEAQDNFRAWSIAKLEERLAQIKSGGKLDLYINHTVPEDHTADYDRALRMLKLHKSDTIELTASDFDRLVENRWEWRHRWLHNNSNYLSSGTMASLSIDESDE